MNYTNVEIIRRETGYRTACELPDTKHLFKTIIGRPNNEVRRQRREACANCLVRLECLADALNDVLSKGEIGVQNSSGYMAGKTPEEQVELAKFFRKIDVHIVTIDHLDGLPAASILTSTTELL